jgi:MerR family mercuric resistance operon transcriptional regulator
MRPAVFFRLRLRLRLQNTAELLTLILSPNLVQNLGGSHSGYRQYDETVVARVQFIRRAKELGFTLAEIKELLGLWFDVNTKCVHVRQKAEQKIADIEDKLRSLQKLKRSLKKFLDQCANRDAVDECLLWLGLEEPRKRKKAGNLTSGNAREK